MYGIYRDYLIDRLIIYFLNLVIFLSAKGQHFYEMTRKYFKEKNSKVNMKRKFSDELLVRVDTDHEEGHRRFGGTGMLQIHNLLPFWAGTKMCLYK